jgi:hypothetical protein
LGAEADELFHKRLKRLQCKKGQYRKKKKVDIKEKKRETQNKKSIQETKEQFTSSIKEVEEQPANMVGSLVVSTLALFGEGAWGLSAGFGCSRFCGGGEVSSPSGRASETTKVRDVLVRAVASAG